MQAPAPAFYFDLASVHAYLLAERILHELPVAAEWRPVLACALNGAPPHDGQPSGGTPGDGTLGEGARRDETPSEQQRSDIERRAQQLGLQPLRWPEPFPFDSTLAMRVASYARQIGRTVAFAQAAFRQAYAGGRSLADEDNVLIAAAACEMHPAAVLRAARMRSVARELERTTEQAASEGVREVPAIVLAGNVLQGEHALALALAELASGATGLTPSA